MYVQWYMAGWVYVCTVVHGWMGVRVYSVTWSCLRICIKPHSFKYSCLALANILNARCTLSSSLFQAPKHLVKFVTFHDHDLYLGINFKKVLHSPSQYCFCLKVSVLAGQSGGLCCKRCVCALSHTRAHARTHTHTRTRYCLYINHSSIYCIHVYLLSVYLSICCSSSIIFLL